MEPTELKLKGPTETTTGSEEVVLPARPAVVEAAAAAAAVANEPRGMKRSRRDRGSSAKERISKMPACVPGKRSSIYRGVTRHRWTGRYEAHLWDKSTWNEAQNKKGKQVYLGAYDDEEAAARAYDLAALKYWGPGTLINFPVTDYARDVEEMQSVSREEYLASLRRKGSGFSRGAAKFKGMTRHPSLGRWEARLGQVLGNKYLYLGNPSGNLPQEEAATASFDIQGLDYRGLNSVSNVDLSRYISWLRPERSQAAAAPSVATPAAPAAATPSKMKEEEEGGASPTSWDDVPSLPDDQSQPSEGHQAWPGQASEPYQLPSLGVVNSSLLKKSSTPSALSLLLTSSIFKSMRERSSHAPGTDVHTKFDPGVEVGAPFLPGPSTSHLYDETSSEMFSPHLNAQYEIGFPPSYGSSAQEGVEVPAVGSQGPPFSQSPAYWDPFSLPLTSQQLTSC